jgi:hypothetical protein
MTAGFAVDFRETGFEIPLTPFAKGGLKTNPIMRHPHQPLCAPGNRGTLGSPPFAKGAGGIFKPPPYAFRALA